MEKELTLEEDLLREKCLKEDCFGFLFEFDEDEEELKELEEE